MRVVERVRRLLPAALAVTLLAACASLGGADTGPAPKLDQLGAFRVAMSGASPAAQRWIEQGLLLAYGFEHQKAASAFEQALREDRDCAMCAWGAAYVLGPNINRSREYVDVQSLKRAFAFAEQAGAIAKRLPPAALTPRDQALIAAIQERYEAEPKPAGKSTAGGRGEAGAMCAAAGSPFSGMAAAAHPREQAYARAMAEAYQRWSADTDVAAMYAESLLMLTPWEWYDSKGKTAHPNAAAAIEVIKKAMVAAPDHPGLIHFLIHVTEQGPDARWAEVGADRLEAAAPGLPHLVHMPSHTYIRIGRYGDAVGANQRALQADQRLAAAIKAQGGSADGNWDFHHLHFLWFAAAMDGQGRVAIDAARRLAAKFDAMQRLRGGYREKLAAELPWLAMVQVERWDDILAAAMPWPWFRHERAVAHFARGMALARGGKRAGDAAAELVSLEVLAASGDGDAIDGAAPTLKVAIASLRGEVAWARGEREQALRWLKRAHELEQSIDGGEVASFGAITAPALGSALLATGQPGEAEAVYRQQLEAWPGDARAWQGLERSLAAKGRSADAQQADASFKAAWARADFMPAWR